MDTDRGNRRFWEAADVAAWIQTNTKVDDPGGPEAAAVWWCVYRQTEALIDDTTRHIAQALLDGVGPFDEDDVTNMVQYWGDEEGKEGDLPGIDAAIEADLRRFFGV